MWLICLGNGVVLSGLDVNDEALDVGLLRGGARDRPAPKHRHNRSGDSPRPRPSARCPFPSLCCASRRFACSASFARTSWLSDRSAAAASTAVRAKSAKIAKIARAREE